MHHGGDLRTQAAASVNRLRSCILPAFATSAFLFAPAVLAQPAPPPAATPTSVPVPRVTAAFPTLKEVLRLARQQAPEAVRARGAIAVAEASYAGARLAPLDNPYLETFVDRGTGGATRDVTIQSNLWLPLEVYGQRGARLAEVDASVALQRTVAASTEFAVVGEAVRAFGGALVAAARVRTLEGIVAGARVEASYHAERKAAGDATMQEATLASLELARNEVLLQEGRAELTRALADLARSTGRTFPAPEQDDPAPAWSRPVRSEVEASRVATSTPHVVALEREADLQLRVRERAAATAHVPLNLIVSAGRGDLGEARFGGGISWTFPVLRRNQSEIARADAERVRALAEAEARKRVVAELVQRLERQRAEVEKAREMLDSVAMPAAAATVEAAVAMRQAGKGELLLVLTARRDLAVLKLRRLELAAREWAILGDLATLTGDLP